MPHYLSTWWIVGGFAVVFVVGAWCVTNLVDDDKEEKEIRAKADNATNEMVSRVSTLQTQRMDGLEQRIDALENPSMFTDERENRTCPNCGIEKEIRTDDYLCDDCRKPQNIAA
jgi:hypothetical protein